MPNASAIRNNVSMRGIKSPRSMRDKLPLLMPVRCSKARSVMPLAARASAIIRAIFAARAVNSSSVISLKNMGGGLPPVVNNQSTSSLSATNKVSSSEPSSAMP